MSGYAIGDDKGIGVMEMPGRKWPALYARRGTTIYPLAYFRSQKAAEEAEELLTLLAQGVYVEEASHE